ncbi:2-polyprenyl-6-methoxyphenol hydroxylase-like FAD-dependent oxidoreductase [Tamaricihabitans halophyticus]|uniref:2-polyprenyl-6-methoxyphenol hydroxylase-like FAD-dependent oxidoreductase n=1 Tax=Tamaricihabitans halophyticus TaxID=1262583 RepID=A0A4R2QY39_9PSEU|nr:FAD-dependent oxidoreductase [Tamaricihabitans halophyticus]TCP52065.1 2-polyprenyl-6-methoxyphenol hydroxylase-like FAD-dependent oxidoreductase [Tamaricihabitans halophyticus]
MTRTTCCVVGGGPAGMMLGLLLARAGVEVTVLEKHGDFLRDFRGDTVHPTTMVLLDELGLGEQFDKMPQSRLDTIRVPTAEGMTPFGDLTRLRGKRPYIAMVPQWDLLDLLAEAGRAEPGFTLRMNTEATELIRSGDRISGVRYRESNGTEGEIHAELTVACDGRGSVLRHGAGLRPREWTTPMDAWWFKLPRKDSDPAGGLGLFSNQRATIFIDRGDYWQTAALIPKGTDSRVRTGEVSTIVKDLAEPLPWLADRTDALRSWDEVKLLDVRLDRLRTWHRDGLLCIGDAAHAMSPVGGVGINLAIQDAVAAARLLAAPLRTGRPSTRDLARVRRRRLPATVLTQLLQRTLHARALAPALDGKIDIIHGAKPPLPLRLMRRWPALQGIPAYVLGRGVRPERAPRFARR